MSIDLHIHSTFSDGTKTPTELVGLAAKKGLKALALTDHDTTEGVDEMRRAAAHAGISTLTGVEISVHEKMLSAHLLGYGFDQKNEKLVDALKVIRQGRQRRNEKILKRLQELGCQIEEAELLECASSEVVGRPHFAKILMRKGHVGTMDEAFRRFLGKDGLAYFSRFSYSFKDAIGLVKAAGGLAILAHPGTLCLMGKQLEALLDRLEKIGLDGVEAYYPSHRRDFLRQLIAIAKKKSLLLTGGSDYHGDIRPQTSLAGGKNVYVPYSVFTSLKERLARN